MNHQSLPRLTVSLTLISSKSTQPRLAYHQIIKKTKGQPEKKSKWKSKTIQIYMLVRLFRFILHLFAFIFHLCVAFCLLLFFIRVLHFVCFYCAFILHLFACILHWFCFLPRVLQQCVNSGTYFTEVKKKTEKQQKEKQTTKQNCIFVFLFRFYFALCLFSAFSFALNLPLFCFLMFQPRLKLFLLNPC